GIVTLLHLAFGLQSFSNDFTVNDPTSDTTKIKIKGKKILIIEDDDTTMVKVEKDKKWWESEGGEEIEHFSGLYLGIQGLRNPQNALNLNPSAIQVDYSSSINVNLNMFEKSARIIG